MAQSFFQLTPITEPPPDAYEDSFTQAEQDALLTDAMALGETLSDAIDAYAASHPGLSYGVILEALRYLQWCMQRELDEESADA
jgi:hypothetical protein